MEFHFIVGHMSVVPYRPEIDGLRAIAVLAVLIFHADFAWLQGGFVGVDIFFVISGYLITSLILKDLKADNFTFRDFWERRARRILPALFVVVLTTCLVGYFIFLPVDYVLFGRQMAVQSVFASNFLFMFEGGYFDTANENKALLHTWSLAIEEQFYLFFPLLMLIIERFLRARFFLILIILTILSFVLCMVAMSFSPRLTFYMLPFRGWELLFGAVIAIIPPITQKHYAQIFSSIGLILIAYSLLYTREGNNFPGIQALWPVLGTVLILWSRESIVHQFLALRPLVAIGLISYSLYLWHWPVLVFLRYPQIIESEMIVALLAIGLSFILAISTWYFVEQPIRKRKVFATQKSIYILSSMMLLIMVMGGLFLIQSKGVPSRLSSEIVSLSEAVNNWNPKREQCDQQDLGRFKDGTLCQTNTVSGIKPDFILWGDSHADSIAPLFYKLSTEKKEMVIL